MAVPENVQQCLITDDGRVVIYLDGFGMVAEAVIDRIILIAPGVADTGADDSG